MNATEVADRLHSAAIHLLRRVRREDTSSGLSAARLSALSVIVYAGPISVGRLAEAEQVRSPTMTRIVDQLVADGFAERRPSAEDARSTLVHPTEAGVRLITEGRRRRVATLAREFETLSPDDLDTLARAVALIEEVLELPRH